MILDQRVLTCHDRLGDVLKEGMEDALGRPAVEAVFKRAGLMCLHSADLKPADLAPLLKAMQELYGPRAGCGMALCTGRACFKYGLKTFGAELGWFDMPFRLRPPAARITAGLDTIAQMIRPIIAAEIRIDQDRYHTLWYMQPGALGAGDDPGTSACHLVTGVLQEFLYWAGGGKYYPIEEKTCILNGASACLLSIDKHPLD
jgi:hypothetical protein